MVSQRGAGTNDEAIALVVANVTSMIDASILDAADGRVGKTPLGRRR
jgi:hypothetical protein